MTQFIFATESYPFTVDVRDLLTSAADTAVLLTKDVHLTMSEEQLACFEQVVVVPNFDYDTLRSAIVNMSPQPGARIVSHDDFFYELFARLNEELGLSGYSTESILPFVDKNVMKQRLQSSNIRIPRYVMFDGQAFTNNPDKYVADVVASVGLPAFAKPTNSAGAENTRLLPDAAALREWCGAHVGADHYELDEFIGAADLYHCDSVIRGGRLVFSQVCRYSCPCADFASGSMLGSYTMDDSEPLAARLRQFAADVIDRFHAVAPVPDGVMHMEIFHTAADELIFLEVQLRPPGANVRVAYQQHLQTNLELYHYLLQMGRDITVPATKGPYAAWLYFPTDEGTVQEVMPIPPLHSSIVEANYFIEPGRRTQRPRSVLDAKGRGVVALSLVVSCPDYARFREDFVALMRHRPYTLSGSLP